MSKISITLDAQNHEFELEQNAEPILDKAIDLGLDPPYSCQGGVCTSCKAKIIEGTTQMDTNFALTDKEVEQGYILTCQAHPTSETLKISYDL